MLNSSMISEYLVSHDELDKTSTLRRTRLSTKKLVGDLRFKLKDIKTTHDGSIAKYKLDGREHQIVFDEESIVQVSCSDCKDFCTHQKILLTQIAQDIAAKEKSPSPIRKKPIISSKRKRESDGENDSNVLNSTSDGDEIKLVKKKKVVDLPQHLVDDLQALKMENIVKSFGRRDFKDFHEHCVKAMSENPLLTKTANDLTVEQADTSIWHELRIGRITASRLHEVTRCTMTRGSLVDKIMGQRSGWSFAMMRGTVLEEYVFEEVKKEYPELQRAGLIMDHNVHPFFAASPDGLHKDFVLEIKCPGTPKTYQEYINVDTLSRKYFAQIQLQMVMTGKTKALLAVAALDFEKTRNIEKIWIPLDEEYVADMIEQATEFYEKAIFPALKRKFLR